MIGIVSCLMEMDWNGLRRKRGFPGIEMIGTKEIYFYCTGECWPKSMLTMNMCY